MEPVKSTVEILAFKVLNRNIDKTWVDWAVDMLMAGFDTENLAILAGEFEPYDQFQLQDLTTKILDELHLDHSEKEKTIENYVYYLIVKALNGEIETMKALRKLKDLCIELNYNESYTVFYYLYFAKDKLLTSNQQWYIKDLDRTNIDAEIEKNLIKRKENFEKKINKTSA